MTDERLCARCGERQDSWGHRQDRAGSLFHPFEAAPSTDEGEAQWAREIADRWVNIMVSAAPEQVKREAEEYFKSDPVPPILSFVSRLSPVHQRLFDHELKEGVARAEAEMTREAMEDLVELVEAWAATADLDSDPERLSRIRAAKQYREVAC